MTVTVKGRPGFAFSGALTVKKFLVGAGVTLSAAVPVLPDGVCVPVTVCGPATVAPQLLAVQLPSGAILKVVAPVTSPRSLAKASWAVTVSEKLPPAVAEAGATRARRVVWATAVPVVKDCSAPTLSPFAVVATATKKCCVDGASPVTAAVNATGVVPLPRVCGGVDCVYTPLTVPNRKNPLVAQPLGFIELLSVALLVPIPLAGFVVTEASE